MSYETIAVQFDGTLCFIQFAREEAGNTITERFIKELHQVLDRCDSYATVVILQGAEEVFCLGVDFHELVQCANNQSFRETSDPELLYRLWMRLAFGPYITISHVKGRANAGGIGFVAASDIVLADSQSEFSLSELLFGLLPACVMPFLVNRVGYQKANYLALSTLPITAQEAKEWGLIDLVCTNSNLVLRKQLSRLRRLSKDAITRQKNYSASINTIISNSMDIATSANRSVFENSQNLSSIRQYVNEGRFPWET